VVVADHVLIGDGCKIPNNVSLYEGVPLEEDVFCGPSPARAGAAGEPCRWNLNDTHLVL
jgi:UDP-2-acetamido-3-amino-2,3-dideoxy-glucuronate N-acetyltransferase